jgi:uncharacterized protein with PIN domain
MRFVCDVMLGKLAKYLRILGFDAVYLKNLQALERYKQEDDPRYFLTRRRRPVTYDRTMYIRAETVRKQLTELKSTIRPAIDPQKILTRCINCNVPLVDAEKGAIEHRVPEFVFHSYSSFKACPSCSHIYWQGTHTVHMNELIDEMTG